MIEFFYKEKKVKSKQRRTIRICGCVKEKNIPIKIVNQDKSIWTIAGDVERIDKCYLNKKGDTLVLQMNSNENSKVEIINFLIMEYE